MRKYIFKDYITTYKALGIDKFTSSEGMVPGYMAFSFLMTVIIGIIKDDVANIKGSIATLIMFLPVFMIIFSSYLHPIRLNKMMQIVPLSEEEKYNYLKDLYLFRISLYVLIALTCNAVALVLGESTILVAIYNIVEAAILASVTPPDQNEKKSRYLGLIIPGFFANMIIVAFPTDLLGPIFAVGVLLIVQVPMLHGHINQIKADLLRAVKYE